MEKNQYKSVKINKKDYEILLILKEKTNIKLVDLLNILLCHSNKKDENLNLLSEHVQELQQKQDKFLCDFDYIKENFLKINDIKDYNNLISFINENAGIIEQNIKEKNKHLN
jgi:hypothetical protein